MNHNKDIARIRDLSQMVLDHRLTVLRETAGRREQTRMQIAALGQAAEPVDLPAVAGSQVALRYQLWADARRSELNTVLARQTAHWLEARQEAQTAFGRAEALRLLAQRLAGRGRGTV